MNRHSPTHESTFLMEFDQFFSNLAIKLERSIGKVSLCKSLQQNWTHLWLEASSEPAPRIEIDGGPLFQEPAPVADKDHSDYMRGSSGDMFASGWGEVGYQSFLQKQEQEKQDKKRQQERFSLKPRNSRSGTIEAAGGNGLRNLALLCLALLAVESYLDLTGFLTNNPQRFAAFFVSIASFVMLYRYWELISKIIIGLIAFSILGLLIQEFVMAD